MKWLLRVLFGLRLTLVSGWGLVTWWFGVKMRPSFVWCLGLGLGSLLLLLPLWRQPLSAPIITINTDPTSNTTVSLITLEGLPNHQLVQYPNTPEKVTQLLSHYQKLLRQQPTDRDILVNAAILATWAGRHTDATTWWLQAKQIDPNSPLFSGE